MEWEQRDVFTFILTVEIPYLGPALNHFGGTDILSPNCFEQKICAFNPYEN